MCILYIINMDSNINQTLKRFYTSSSTQKRLSSKKKHFFYHVDCKFSRRKFCFCKSIKPKKEDFQLMDILDILSNDHIKFDLVNNTVLVNKVESKQYNEELNKIVEEKISILNPIQVSRLMTEMKGDTYTNNEYNEVYKSIQNEKKYCENCRSQLIENNYHKGWKNPNTGDAVLLCPMCNKKYLSGVLENQPSYNVSVNINSSSVGLYKNDDEGNLNKTSFKVSSN